ncbi:hypothetical protein KEM14_gp23 [Xanthomonas virus phiXaf18]|uniref:Uncharacterized protein n=1 Tax=Xanthomonas virus phiXaf18 TaxID=2653651 RepID=A0A5P8PQN0_9CAUD|nr:hypothetical protein KEM14_gp23 [Xanthomonas virus phiXaf18]QFR59584.1 hypothetical protein phiXaf18_23 [Xanthomonas virus phiXaf18]
MDAPVGLVRFIATRDRRVAKYSWKDAAVTELWETLMQFGQVTVGGRASCGSKVDATWVTFTAWNEVVAKAAQMGITIFIEPIKQGNAWATKSGGFWEENRYSIITPR